jgi:hypothetical protein
MATAPAGLHLFNATTKSELRLTKAGGFYQVGDEILICDLYTDPAGKGDSILLIQRRAPIEKLPDGETAPAK